MNESKEMNGKDAVQRLPKCRVVYRNKIPELDIEGVKHGVIASYIAAYLRRSDQEQSRSGDSDMLEGGTHWGCNYDITAIREMYRSGVRIFQINISSDLYWKEGDVFECAALVRDLTALAAKIKKHAPNCYFMIGWGLYVPEWWGKAYPDELVKYHDGTHKTFSGEHASYASPSWRRRAGEMLTQTLEAIIDSELAASFVGVKLSYGNAWEWNNFGYHERRFPDFSDCMKKAYQEWGGTEIPTAKERLRDRHKTLRSLPEGKNTADFYRFWQEYSADTILHFAHIIRTVTAGQSLVGTYYGYFIGHLYHFTGPYHFQDSGHYGVSRLIESEDIDFLGGPFPYDERLVCDVPQSAYSSVQLHGKFWFSENDQRTHRSETEGRRGKFGETKNLSETLAITWRNFACNLTKGCVFYFYDFIIGWYREPEFFSVLRRCRKVEAFLKERQVTPSPEVAIFFSEESVPYMGNGKNEVLTALARMMRRELDMAGAPYAFYTMNDIGTADLSGCKTAIFLNAYAIPEAQRRAIEEKVLCDNRTVVFLHSAACVDGDRIDVQKASDWIGIHFEEKDDMTTDRICLCENQSAAEIREQASYSNPVTTPAHKLTGFLNTVYVVEDEETTPLARYTYMPYIAAAEKKKEDCSVIYWAMPSLNEAELQMLYARSGVHLYTTAEAVVYAMGQFVCLYSRKKQKTTVCFPRAGEVVFDLMTGEALARDTDRVEVAFGEDAESRFLYAGTREDWEYFISMDEEI